MSLLEEVQVDLVVDVRSIPRSRTNPQFNLDVDPMAAGHKQPLTPIKKALKLEPAFSNMLDRMQ